MHTDIHHELWLKKASIALVLSGATLLVYGAVMTMPLIYGFLLNPPTGVGSIVEPGMSPPALEVPHGSPSTVPLRVPQSVFLAGCLLIVGGACLDVRRRLRHL